MREAIGGTWLMWIVLTFVVLFSAFLALAMNYTKAFKVKNEIINLIERNEGYTTSGDNNVANEAKDYLEKVGYNNTVENIRCPDTLYPTPTDTTITDEQKMVLTTAMADNYCVYPVQSERGEEGKQDVYYVVTTFVMIEVPLMWRTFSVPVSGETKRIFNNCMADQDCTPNPSSQ